LARRWQRFCRRLDGWIAPICARSKRWSSWYYGFWNPSFRREHHAVLIGRLRFEEMRRRPRASSSLLRRNTHRLEKGLLSQPRRAVFALDYIEETVQGYIAALQEADHSERVADEELQWAKDVLDRYFELAGTHPLVDRLREAYRRQPADFEAPPPERAPTREPYRRDLSGTPPVAYADLLQLARRRRSVRWFLPRPVPREAIERAVAVAAESPSACNRQPFEFRVFDDPALLRQVADLPAGTAGFSHNFPCVIVVLGRLRNYFDERDRHLIYIDGALATMGFVYAIESQGLSTCCINWPDIPEREEAARALLRLDPDERPVMFIAVGYPDPEGLVAYSQKKPIRQLCRFNFEAPAVRTNGSAPDPHE
jgi:nitroreductase